MSKITSTQLHLGEAASAGSSTAAEGQIWVKSDAPSSLYHTDDTGVDHRINGTTFGTNTTTTGGTTIVFGSIPTGVTEIIVMIAGISWSGTGDTYFQLGDAGGIETSGYVGMLSTDSGVTQGWSSGATLQAQGVAASVHSGMIICKLMNAATFHWAIQHQMANTQGTFNWFATGYKALSAELTQLRLISSGGSETVDALVGMNIQYN